jgi:hypothetical protein
MHAFDLIGIIKILIIGFSFLIRHLGKLFTSDFLVVNQISSSQNKIHLLE